MQYHAPWFRHVAKHCPAIDLTVLYASRPTATQQASSLVVAFEWDVPLLDGYRNRVVRESQPDDRFDSDAFRGLDVPEIGQAIGSTHGPTPCSWPAGIR